MNVNYAKAPTIIPIVKFLINLTVAGVNKAAMNKEPMQNANARIEYNTEMGSNCAVISQNEHISIQVKRESKI